MRGSVLNKILTYWPSMTGCQNQVSSLYPSQEFDRSTRWQIPTLSLPSPISNVPLWSLKALVGPLQGSQPWILYSLWFLVGIFPQICHLVCGKKPVTVGSRIFSRWQKCHFVGILFSFPESLPIFWAHIILGNYYRSWIWLNLWYIRSRIMNITKGHNRLSPNL